MKNLMRFALVAIALVSLGSRQSNAAFDPGVSITPNPGMTNNNGLGYTIGFTFRATTNLMVNALGYFDYNGMTLSNSHDVGIWNSSGVLLASATIDNSGTLLGQFRYTSISSITLSGGQTYTVGGVSGTLDPYAFNPTSVAFDPRVTYISAQYSPGSTLTFPTTTDPAITAGYFGGTFGIQSAAVPEPSSLALCGIAAVAGLGYAGTRRNRLT